MLFLDFLPIFLFFDRKWAKMAQNGSKMPPKIFSQIFYQIMYFNEFLVIFSDFLDYFWPFLIFWTQNSSKWIQKGQKNIFSHFLSNYVFLWIFGDFFRFFGPFLTILDFWGPGTNFYPSPGPKNRNWAKQKKTPPGIILKMP